MRISKYTKINASGIPAKYSKEATLLGHVMEGDVQIPFYSLRNGCYCTVKAGVGKMINPFAFRNWLKEREGKVEFLESKPKKVVLQELAHTEGMMTELYNFLISDYPPEKVDKDKITKMAIQEIVNRVCSTNTTDKERKAMITFLMIYFMLYRDWVLDEPEQEGKI